MRSIALLAYSKGLPVNIYTDGTCSPNGVNGTDIQVGTWKQGAVASCTYASLNSGFKSNSFS